MWWLHLEKALGANTFHATCGAVETWIMLKQNKKNRNRGVTIVGAYGSSPCSQCLKNSSFLGEQQACKHFKYLATIK